MAISFDEEQQENEFRKINDGTLKKSRMTAWLIKKGIVKTEKKAQFVLLAIVIICIAATYVVSTGYTNL